MIVRAGILVFLLLTGIGTGIAGEDNRDSLLLELSRVKDKTLKVNLLNQVAYSHVMSDLDSCKLYMDSALQIAESIDYQAGIAKAYSVKSFYFMISDQYQEAIKASQYSVSIHKKLGDKARLSSELTNLGIAYQYHSEFNLALDCYLEALELQRKVGNKDQKLIGSIYGNLGNLYNDHKEPENAQQYYKKALVIFERLGNIHRMATLYSNAGLAFKRQHQYDSALIYFDRAIEIDLANGSKWELANNYSNKGLVLKSMMRWDEAHVFYDKSKALNQELGHEAGVASNLAGLSGLYLEKGKRDKEGKVTAEIKQRKRADLLKGLELGLESARMHEKIGSKRYQVYDIITYLYLELDSVEKAIAYADKYFRLKNEVFSVEKARDFARLEAKHERELSKSKIALLEAEKASFRIYLWSIAVILSLVIVLAAHYYYQSRNRRKTNRLLSELNQQLEVAIDSKDRFLSILAHDLKNPIGGVNIALKLLAEDLPKMDKAEIKNYLNKLSLTTAQANDLLMNLLEWSRTQKGLVEFKPTQVRMARLIQYCFELHKNLADDKQISLKHQCAAAITLHADEHMLKSIICNLLANSIKFTRRGGQISVQVQVEQNELQCSVSDTGIGMTNEQIEHLFDVDNNVSTPGTEKEHGTGLGLAICKEFVKAHQGRITAHSEKGKGTTIAFMIPLQKQ